MNKYHFNIRLSNVRYNHAGSKAVDDCKAILINSGFEDVEISFIKKAYMMPVNLIKLFCLLALYKFKIKPNSLVITQYPLLGINKYFKHFTKLLKSKNCKLVCIIHDLDSIRSDNKSNQVINEIDAVSAYDAVIAHNASMANWLKTNGYQGQIVTIDLFDYLATEASIQPAPVTQSGNEVAFAGNLGRCHFLADLNRVEGMKFNLYGPGLNSGLAFTNPGIQWKGSFTPGQIVNELKGSYGLIWDGTSIETYSGIMGNYLKYNTPHKASLYLVSGIPVIVHKTAAIADYISTNELGIVIDSLLDLRNELASVTEEQYAVMKSNVITAGEKIRNGYFLKKAIDGVIIS